MLIPFQSKAAGEFFMQQPHVQALFALMGKPFSAQGVFAADELNGCLSRLTAGLEHGAVNAETSESADESRDAPSVGLKQRAWPLMDMMRRAQKLNVDVVWGVTV